MKASIGGTQLRFAEAVRAVTPESPGCDTSDEVPRYGILAHPAIGHVLHYVAHRATPADPLGPYIGRENFQRVLRFHRVESEFEALRKLAAENAELRDRLARLEGLMMDGAEPDRTPYSAVDLTKEQRAEIEPLMEASAPIPDVNDPGAEFEEWTKEDLKAFIGDATGVMPGTRATKPDLVETAKAALKEKMAAVEAA